MSSFYIIIFSEIFISIISGTGDTFVVDVVYMNMFDRKLVISLVVLLASLTACASGAPEDSEERVNEIVSGAKNSAEAAGRLYKAAEEIQDNAEGKIFLLNKAVEFGMDHGGSSEAYAVAEKALNKLSELHRRERPELEKKQCQLYEKWYRIRGSRDERRRIGQEWFESEVDLAESYADSQNWADAVEAYRRVNIIGGSLNDPYTAYRLKIIKESLVHADHMLDVQQQVKNLQRTLNNHPDNIKLRENITMTCLVELNDPTSARKYIKGTIDEVLATYVPLAAKEISRLSEEICLELGRWYYKTLYKKAKSRGSKVAMLRRARDYYSRYLNLHQKKDAGALNVTTRLNEIKDEYEKYKPEDEFENFLKRVKVLSGGYRSGNIVQIRVGDELVLGFEGEAEDEDEYNGTGISMVVCRDENVVMIRSYNTYSGRSAADELAATVDKLPVGTYVVLAVKDEATKRFNERAYQAVRSIGGKINLANAPFRCSYFCIGQKGRAPGRAVEKMNRKKMAGYPSDFIAKIREKYADDD